ncbi:MAG TPA: hypothetical protein VNO20_10665 [Solirubrobacterales bacterium]|nr:hypothetical protein [Solirubrobacterales bacterium]
MKRLGPELKVPDFLADLYWDLRERRLLPLVALLIVGIVAVPFLLGGDSDEEPAMEAPTAGASKADAARFTVVEAKPGLRDYRKRLQHRTPTDPFKQRHAGPVLNGAQLNSQSATLSGGESEVTSTTESGSGLATEPAEPGGTAPPPVDGDDGPGLKFFEFVTDVQISRTETQADGRQVMGEPEVRRRVPALTPLPGAKTPVVTTMGVNIVKQKVLFMVSPEVTSLFGDAHCVSGTESCQLLEVKPGFPLTFVYGPNAVRYKIKVIKVDVIWVSRKEAGRLSAKRRNGLVQSFSK